MLKNNKGFTLIELLLVVVIIGLMLAVIVPRAWRANIDAKYGLVRQNCSELASFAQEWAEGQILNQDAATATANVDDYFATLASIAIGTANATGTYIANQATGVGSNWTQSGAGLIAITGRFLTGVAGGQAPDVAVEGIIPPEKTMTNPFNGTSVFVSSNDPLSVTNPIPGAIYCGYAADGAVPNLWSYYGLVYQGTDSTTTTRTGTSFYAGQDVDLQGLKNGIFMARVRP